jgi:hypothetical protein
MAQPNQTDRAGLSSAPLLRARSPKGRARWTLRLLEDKAYLRARVPRIRCPRCGFFSCGDAQRYRISVNHHHIAVNGPICPYHSDYRDGAMRTDGHLGGTPTYWPNRRGQWEDRPQLNPPPLAIGGLAAR